MSLNPNIGTFPSKKGDQRPSDNPTDGPDFLTEAEEALSQFMKKSEQLKSHKIENTRSEIVKIIITGFIVSFAILVFAAALSIVAATYNPEHQVPVAAIKDIFQSASTYVMPVVMGVIGYYYAKKD